MTSKVVRLFLAAAVLVGISALAQTGSAGTPVASAATPAVSTPSVPATASSTRVGTINVEQAVVGSNEGRRDFEALSKKLEPKQTELKGQNDELEALQKQLQTQQDKLNADALASLQKQIETKKKSFDRAVQDAQEDAQGQQKEIFQRILQKMAPVIVKYAQDNGIGMIVDTSNPWPQSPILWAGQGVDITRPIVEAYNVQSGVPAPASAATAKPASPKPVTGTSGATPKPATPKPTEAPK
ncbi:MAG: OmpH family outer membrane protein [Acidobacteriia bacterium]|nr:OmpH family outer membrane protein [Terriglobia bacterium]